jgi:hypothetical protein
MRELPLARLALIAEFMQALRPSPEATLSYDQFSDALVWSDEWPAVAMVRVPECWCLRPVFRYRSSLVLGAPDITCETYWNEALRLFPQWAGFEPRRRCRSWAPVLEEFRREASADLNRLFDEQ